MEKSAEDNEYGIRLYSKVGPSQERQEAPRVSDANLVEAMANCHQDCHNVCHTNCHSNCHSNTYSFRGMPEYAPAMLRDTKLSEMFNVREDNKEFGFIHSIGTGAIFIAPAETIRMISGIMDRGVAEVTAEYPSLIEALTP